MAEPRPFRFDSKQRSVGAAGSRRRIAWPWIALSLALHGAIILFALVGAARGGHTELLGTFEVTVVGAPSAGDPDSRSSHGEAETDPEPTALPRPEAPPTLTESPPMPQPSAVPRPSMVTPPREAQKEPARPETVISPPPPPQPRSAAQAETAPTEPLSRSEDALKRPEAPKPPETTAPRKAERAEPAPAEPRPHQGVQVPPPPPPAKIASAPTLPHAKSPRAAATPSKAAPRAGIKQAPAGQTASLGAPTGGDRLGRSDNDDTAGLLNINLNPRFRAPPPPPIYPRQSIERDEEGVVFVRAFVDPSGAPQRVVIWKGSGFPLLDEAALKAVQGWRFEPMVRDGRVTASWVQVPVRFRLN
jgi:protein TonB